MIVALQGGLGNQMFQYAFGASVAKARGEKLFFSRNRVDADPKREYALAPFNLPIEFAEEKEPFYYDNYLFDPGVYTAPKDSTFVGHWQTEKYFDVPLVQKALQLPHFRYVGNCAIHVRMTDYLVPEALAYHGICSQEYYRHAVQYVQRQAGNCYFTVFSDDPEKAKAMLPIHAFFIKGNAPHEDIAMMSGCDYAIIANSSFSWWGAYLGADWSGYTVIAPKRWYVNGPLERDICPDRWVRLDN